MGDEEVDGKNSATRTRLTRERVVAVALELVDRDGLDRLTMRNLGRELGVDPMAPYHWFPNKRAILQGVYAEILDEVEISQEPNIGWPEALKSIARSYHRALLAHPNAVPMIASQPVMSVRGLGVVERAASLLVRNGLTPRESIQMINGVAALVNGSALAEAGATTGADPIQPSEVEAWFTTLDAVEFPMMLRATEEAGEDAFDQSSGFEQLLDALVLGFETQWQRRLTT